MSAQMNAQMIYDLRDEYADFDGRTLHALFDALTGDPSPAGSTPITLAALGEVARAEAGTEVGEAAQAVLVSLARR